jgi:hypothetical protein
MRYKLLEAMRLTAIVEGIQDARFLTPDLRWLGRTPVIPRDEADILAGFTGDVFVADILTDDAKAVTYTEGAAQMKTHIVPNIKHGFRMDQKRTNDLVELAASGAARGTKYASFVGYLQEKAAELVEGIRQRMDIMCLQMRLDTMTYNRLGVILNGITWGMPASLKTTVAVMWTDPVNSTPITDIETYLRNAAEGYGIIFTRITLSTKALTLIVNSDEFKDRLALIIAPSLSVNLLPFGNLPYMQTLVQQLLSGITGSGPGQGNPITIELDDRRFKQQHGDGSTTYLRPFPADMLLFDNPVFDNNAGAMRFANAVVTETVISSVVDTGMIGKFNAPQRGPVSYAVPNQDFNPPNIAVWAVARGFPEKVAVQATGRMRVGFFADGIVRQPDIF